LTVARVKSRHRVPLRKGTQNDMRADENINESSC